MAPVEQNCEASHSLFRWDIEQYTFRLAVLLPDGHSNAARLKLSVRFRQRSGTMGSPSAACRRVALQSVLSAAPTHAAKCAPVSASVKGSSGFGSARQACRCSSVLVGISGVVGHIRCMHACAVQ